MSLRMTDELIIKIIGEIIDILKKNGIEIKSPYDLVDFVKDYIFDEYGAHSYILATRKFDDPDEDRY